jgi:hypothetical protein
MFKWIHGGPWQLIMEERRLKMESGKVCRPVAVDLHHFDEEQVPGTNPH